MRLTSVLRRLFGSGKPVDRWETFPALVTPESLGYRNLDAEGKRGLFKRSVRLVELEPHAYCNRICSFCPNATIDRRTIKTRLSSDLYAQILGDLASIGYDGVLRFGRYSEPMADDHIYDLVAQARRALPKAEIDIVSNGDYLKADSPGRLGEAGLSVLRISVYLREGTPWTPAAAHDEIARLARRLGISPVWHDPTVDTVGADFASPGLKIACWSHDFDTTGYDRGQLLEALIDRTYVRRAPCSLVFTNFTVDFDGTVMPCCNLRGDHPQHKDYVVGKLGAGRSIFDVYAARELAGWRRSLAGVSEKDAPCRTCKQKTVDGDALLRLDAAIRPRLAAMGEPPSS
jgi:radical SAM protein with 4Fe4S-binding SPASM domain